MSSAWYDYQFKMDNIEQLSQKGKFNGESFTAEVKTVSQKTPSELIFVYNNKQNIIEWEEDNGEYIYKHKIDNINTNLTIAFKRDEKVIIAAKIN